jgi:protein-S-isoprenylcysteine O-methyltransferase Ste14
MAAPGEGGGDTAGVIARPPLLYGGFLLAGLALEWLWPLGAFTALSWDRLLLTGGMLMAIGVGLLVAAFRRFKAVGTNIPTWQPSTALATDGIYRISRNPIYLGLTLIYAGLAIALGSFWPLVLLVPLFLVMRYGVIAREETYLTRLFGDDYRAYCTRVRRWL